MAIETRPTLECDHSSILALVETLSEWFTPEARQHMIPFDVRHQAGFVAVSDDEIIGFITLFFTEGRINIGWLGVRRDRRGGGVGTLLLARAEEFGKQQGATEIGTYTLGDSVDYAPYEATRQFYFKRGFTTYQRSKTDNPDCPEELKISKKLM